jgi:hypothetical protein
MTLAQQQQQERVVVGIDQLHGTAGPEKTESAKSERDR